MKLHVNKVLFVLKLCATKFLLALFLLFYHSGCKASDIVIERSCSGMQPMSCFVVFHGTEVEFLGNFKCIVMLAPHSIPCYIDMILGNEFKLSLRLSVTSFRFYCLVRTS